MSYSTLLCCSAQVRSYTCEDAHFLCGMFCRHLKVVELLVQTGAHLQEPDWDIGTQLCM